VSLEAMSMTSRAIVSGRQPRSAAKLAEIPFRQSARKARSGSWVPSCFFRD